MAAPIRVAPIMLIVFMTLSRLKVPVCELFVSPRRPGPGNPYTSGIGARPLA